MCKCALHNADTYRFHQVPVQAIKNDIQEAVNKISNVQSISRPVESTINTIEVANTVATQLDTINSTYLQPLRIFNTVVIGIANVCLLTNIIKCLIQDLA